MTVVLLATATPNEIGVQELDGVLYPFTGCCGARVVRLGTTNEGFVGTCAKCAGQLYGRFDHVSLTITAYDELDMKVVISQWTGLLKRSFTLNVQD